MKSTAKFHAFKLALAVSSILVFVEALGASRRF
jgi:hypothetical protein